MLNQVKKYPTNITISYYGFVSDCHIFDRGIGIDLKKR